MERTITSNKSEILPTPKQKKKEYPRRIYEQYSITFSELNRIYLVVVDFCLFYRRSDIEYSSLYVFHLKKPNVYMNITYL